MHVGGASMRLAALALTLVVLAGGLASLPSQVGSQQREQSVAVTANVDAGGWQGIRLSNLPRGAQLAVQLIVEHELRAMVIDEDQFQLLPNVQWPLAAMAGGGTLRFQMAIPASGTYYLVLDNRSGGRSNRVGVAIRASLN